MTALRIGVIADYDPCLPYHPATTAAIEHAAASLGLDAAVDWIPTPRLTEPDAEELLAGFNALIAAPGSPYRSFEGALRGIRFARERGKPFVGT